MAGDGFYNPFKGDRVRQSDLLLPRCVVRFLAGCAALTLALLLSAPGALAHAPNENYIWLNVEEDHLSGRFEFDADYLKRKLGIDWKSRGDTEAEAVANSAEEVWDFLVTQFEVVANGTTVPLIFERTEVVYEGIAYAQFHFRTAPFDVPETLTLKNTVFQEQSDFRHRSLIVYEYNRRLGLELPFENAVLAFGPRSQEQVLDLADPLTMLRPRDMVVQGLVQTIRGLDNVLFILTVLMTTVLARSAGDAPAAGWKPVDRLSTAMRNAALVVILLAVAQSLMLNCVVSGVINPDAGLVGAGIALSLVFAGLVNLVPRLSAAKWVPVVIFGLVHGMGHAAAMEALQFRTGSIWKMLGAFNIGLVIGMLLVALVAFAVFFAIRRTVLYRRGGVIGGSIAVALVGAFWTIERVLGL